MLRFWSRRHQCDSLVMKSSSRTFMLRLKLTLVNDSDTYSFDMDQSKGFLDQRVYAQSLSFEQP